MLAHTGILSSSLSLMAQGFGVTIGVESGLSRSTLWQDPRQTLADFTLRQRCRRTEQHKPATGTAASL